MIDMELLAAEVSKKVGEGRLGVEGVKHDIGLFKWKLVKDKSRDFYTLLGGNGVDEVYMCGLLTEYNRYGRKFCFGTCLSQSWTPQPMNSNPSFCAYGWVRA